MPGHGNQEGRLTILLLSMTALSGLVDAVSILRLGHVFVANMTGNVVLLAVALTGPPGLRMSLPLVALAGFLFGGLVGGQIYLRRHRRRRRWLTTVMAVQTVLMAGALVSTALWLDRGGLAQEGIGLAGRAPPGDAGMSGAAGDGPLDLGRHLVTSLLAVAMGVQHATARRLARPDIPTNVLTTALTGLVIDSRLGGGAGSRPRRLLAPVTMFAGALTGAAALLYVHLLVPLGAGLLLTAAGLVGAATGRLPGPEEPARPGPAPDPGQPPGPRDAPGPPAS